MEDERFRASIEQMRRGERAPESEYCERRARTGLGPG